jgi:hypothetical protein
MLGTSIHARASEIAGAAEVSLATTETNAINDVANVH